MAFSLRRSVIKVWSFLHAFWLIAGISLLMLLLVEGCFRVKSAVAERRTAERPRTLLAGDPRALDWYAAYTKEFDDTRVQHWRPYVYFAREAGYRGRYINIDSLSRRVTPQPTTPATPAARVFFFGGSTMWGTSQREDRTIAAEAMKRLQPLAGPGGRVEVVNYAETGYVFTQELLLLELALRAGARPDVVVFYDGLNEVASTVQYGTSGVPQNEYKRASEFEMGRALDRAVFARGLGKDARALGLLTGQAFQQLALTDWVKSIKRVPPPQYISADSGARATARLYVETVRLVEALGARYGFTPVYVWQPSLHASEKQLNPFEQRLRRNIERDPFHSRLQAVHRLVPPMLDSAMAGAAPGRFVQAAFLFRGDTIPVYTDWLGHNTEASVPKIVDAFWPVLQRATQEAIARRGSTTMAASVSPDSGPRIVTSAAAGRQHKGN